MPASGSRRARSSTAAEPPVAVKPAIIAPFYAGDSPVPKVPSMRILVLPALALLLPGCLAKTAVDVVTLPVKIASAGVDAVVTTQAEADAKRGRQIRKQEECIGKEERQARKQGREPDYAKCEPKR